MMSANTCPGPTEGSWSMSPTISSAASSGVAFISACISMTSTMEASSTTSRSQSSGLSALRVNPPPLGSTSRSRWIVLASTPVASVMRLPRRAPGSRASKTRSGVWALALMTIFPSPFTRTNLSPEFTPSSAVQKAMPSRSSPLAILSSTLKPEMWNSTATNCTSRGLRKLLSVVAICLLAWSQPSFRRRSSAPSFRSVFGAWEKICDLAITTAEQGACHLEVGREPHERTGSRSGGRGMWPC